MLTVFLTPETSNANPITTPIFFIIWIFIGNNILFNLFLAILLDGFDNVSESDDRDPLADENEILKELIKTNK